LPGYEDQKAHRFLEVPGEIFSSSPLGRLDMPHCQLWEPYAQPAVEAIQRKGRDVIVTEWTTIPRHLISSQALDEAKERFEESKDDVRIFRILAKHEVQKLIDRTKKIRELREEAWITDEEARTIGEAKTWSGSISPLSYGWSRRPINQFVETSQGLPPSGPDFQIEGTWDQLSSRNYGSYTFDDSSSSSSYARSAFSTASLASSATDLSKNSGYSAVQIARATKELVLILQDDEDLVPLYKRAIEDVVIGPAKLERNLRRFFKAYADHLGDIAGDRLEYLASRLVRLKAKLVVRSIMEKYGTEQEAMQRQESNSRQEQEQSSDEENEVHPVDETEFHDLVSFRNFLVGSEAFGMLRTRIRSFILPRNAVGGETEAGTKEVESTTEDDGIAREDDEPAEEEVEVTTEAFKTTTMDIENPTKDIDITTIDIDTAKIYTEIEKLHAGQDRILANRSLSLAKYIEFAKDFAGAALVAFGYLEPALQPGLTRLRWQCVSASMI
jgi:predicted DNA-binding protein